ncbi:response regulator [Halomicrobium sp. LC1Hm]|uniref:response regulator n=1 Tax=Halomicrobium sp. LC1Hm TaxID=2610902 RepID=UPI0012984E70|nr:response regulator [Halomicrobium sp. LC1Hm]QGA84414.1 hypothetical protein LC1Hm_4079 [Halomicrobium sp. LC1Hm]
MNDYDVWWIDDSEDRRVASDALEDNSDDLTVTFDKPGVALDILTDKSKPVEYDLVLIDWKLQDHSEFRGKGLTMMGRVREEMPAVPIYGFSDAVDELRATAGDHQFDATYDASQLKSEDGATNVEKDLESYESIRHVEGAGLEPLLETLGAPKDAYEDLKSVIPREYANGIQAEGEGSVREFAYWVRNRFVETPGPVLDNTWWATKIGLEKEALENHVDELTDVVDKPVLYDGVFDHRCDRRWWTSQAISSVVALAKDHGEHINELTMVGKDILGESEGLSYCRVCELRESSEQIGGRPDILAAGREGEDADHPVHLGCSHIHHTREGAFEDYRVADMLE